MTLSFNDKFENEALYLSLLLLFLLGCSFSLGLVAHVHFSYLESFNIIFKSNYPLPPPAE
jgi:hypothetical protein